MTPPAARRRSQFIDAVIDDHTAAHSTPPDADQLEILGRQALLTDWLQHTPFWQIPYPSQPCSRSVK